MSNFLGGFQSSSQLPAIDGVKANVGDMAYTVDDGGFWNAVQPSAPPGAQPQWYFVDSLKGAPGPQGPVGVGLPGAQGQIGPPGKIGGTGPQGPAGKNSFSFLGKMFNVPSAGGPAATVTVNDSSWMTPGLLVYIPGAGTFTCVGSPPSPNTVILANSGDPANAAPGTLISAGTQVSPASLRGPMGAIGGPGPAGPPGPQGVSGASVYTTLAQPWTVPAVSGTAFVVKADAFGIGLIVYVAGAGYFSVSGVNVTNETLTLVNQNYPGDQPPGTVVPAGNTVSGTGPQGPIGPPGPQGIQGIQGPMGFAPTGTIAMYGAASPPGGWLLCNGASVSRTGYAALFSIISTTYGTGDGSSTFNLPNLQGRFAMGSSATHAMASTGGEEAHALSVDELAVHDHTLFIAASDSGHAHIVPAHGHEWNDNNHANLVPAHGHGWNDSGHVHGNLGSSAGRWTPGGGGDWFTIPSYSSYWPGVQYGLGGPNKAVGSVADAGAFWTGGPNIEVGFVENAAAFWSDNGNAAITAWGTAADTGSGTPHNNLSPYQVVQYIIKT